VLARVTREARLPARVARARCVGLRGRPGVPAGGAGAGFLQRDAVHRAHRQAQLAAGAVGLDHGVHALGRADDRVHRAGLDAQRAADARGFLDVDDAARRLVAERRVERQFGLPELVREPADALGTAGRALVQLRLAGGECVGVRAAVGVAAARALGLRQQRVQALRERKRRDACRRRRARAGRRDGGTHRPDYPRAGAVTLTVLRDWVGAFTAAEVAAARAFFAAAVGLAVRPLRSCSKRAMKSRTCG